MWKCLSNKVVVITGASSGIGACTAKYMAVYQPKLVLVARSKDKLKMVQATCEEAGCGKGNVATVVADLGKQEEVERVIQEALSAFGQLHVLVNNAAAFVCSDVEHTSPESFDRTMAVNVRAPFFLSRAAMPHLKKTQGSIINISSGLSTRPHPHLAAYCISKAALENFTRVLALELASSNVRVNAVVVGSTLTDTREEVARIMGITGVCQFWAPSSDLQAAISHLESRKEHEAEALKHQPLGGDCKMEDVAKVVTFLTSDLAGAMTGTCLPVDRGSLVASSQSEVLAAAFINVGDMNSLPTEVVLEKMAAEVAAKKGKKTK